MLSNKKYTIPGGLLRNIENQIDLVTSKLILLHRSMLLSSSGRLPFKPLSRFWSTIMYKINNRTYSDLIRKINVGSFHLSQQIAKRGNRLQHVQNNRAHSSISKYSKTIARHSNCTCSHSRNTFSTFVGNSQTFVIFTMLRISYHTRVLYTLQVSSEWHGMDNLIWIWQQYENRQSGASAIREPFEWTTS